MTDANGNLDVFLYQRSSAAVSVLSHQGGSATVTANGFSEARALSADGDWALLHSEATDLVDGLSDLNGTQDVFVYQRSNGASTLISRSTDAQMSTANNFSQPTALSADGAWILFVSPASDLVHGVSGVNGTQDVFVADNGADRLFNNGFE